MDERPKLNNDSRRGITSADVGALSPSAPAGIDVEVTR